MFVNNVVLFVYMTFFLLYYADIALSDVYFFLLPSVMPLKSGDNNAMQIHFSKIVNTLSPSFRQWCKDRQDCLTKPWRTGGGMAGVVLMFKTAFCNYFYVIEIIYSFNTDTT